MAQSTFYVDIENLMENAKQALTAAIENWPEGFPTAGVLKLYVRADQTELWRLWASNAFPSVEIQVKGVQHYTFTGSKNSADLFLALDAFADLLKHRTEYVAILSDDSDYASLFSAIKQEIVPENNAALPFKWFMTSRSNTRSSLLTDFFPAQYVHTIDWGPRSHVTELPAREKPVIKPIEPPVIKQMETPIIKQLEPPVIKPVEPPPERVISEEERIARAIIQEIPVGLFKSGDCKKIVARIFPQHHLSKVDGVIFGTQFSKSIWPILERYGVKPGNLNRKPRRYEMTEEAKKAVGQ